MKKSINYEYWKFPEKGYPKTVWWKVITPKNYKLSILQEYDLIFDKHDEKIRQL